MTTGEFLALYPEIPKLASLSKEAGPLTGELGKAIGGFLKKRVGAEAAKGFGHWWGPITTSGAFKKYLLPGLIVGGVGGAALT